MRAYELTFIVRPDVSEDDLTATIEQVRGWITTQDNTVGRVDRWGRRRLAYPINNQREGHYVMMEASLAPETIAELERNLKLSDVILRYLLIRADSK
jgi:small subunit ribosomal protein S6